MKTIGITIYGIPEDKNRATKIQVIGNIKNKNDEQVQNIQIIQSKVIELPDECTLVLEEVPDPIGEKK